MASCGAAPGCSSNGVVNEDTVSSTSTKNLDDIFNSIFICCKCNESAQGKSCKLLQCLHTVCAACFISGTTEERFDCPLCLVKSDTTKIVENFVAHGLDANSKPVSRCNSDPCPDNAVAGFHCVQCDDNLCAKCKDAHQRVKYTKDHQILPINENRGGLSTTCQKHSGEELALFCNTCKMLTCRDCQLSQEHSGHHEDYAYVNDAVNSQKSKLLDFVTAAENKLNELTRHHRSAVERLDCVERVRESRKREIRRAAEMVMETLKKRVDTLGRMIDAQCDQRREAYTEVKTPLERMMAMVSQGCQFAKTICSLTDKHTLLHSVQFIRIQTGLVYQARKHFDVSALQQPEQPINLHLPRQSLIDHISNFGTLFPDSSNQPSTSNQDADIHVTAVINSPTERQPPPPPPPQHLHRLQQLLTQAPTEVPVTVRQGNGGRGRQGTGGGGHPRQTGGQQQHSHVSLSGYPSQMLVQQQQQQHQYQAWIGRNYPPGMHQQPLPPPLRHMSSASMVHHSPSGVSSTTAMIPPHQTIRHGAPPISLPNRVSQPIHVSHPQLYPSCQHNSSSSSGINQHQQAAPPPFIYPDPRAVQCALARQSVHQPSTVQQHIPQSSVPTAMNQPVPAPPPLRQYPCASQNGNCPPRAPVNSGACAVTNSAAGNRSGNVNSQSVAMVSTAASMSIFQHGEKESEIGVIPNSASLCQQEKSVSTPKVELDNSDVCQDQQVQPFSIERSEWTNPPETAPTPGATVTSTTADGENSQHGNIAESSGTSDENSGGLVPPDVVPKGRTSQPLVDSSLDMVNGQKDTDASRASPLLRLSLDDSSSNDNFSMDTNDDNTVNVLLHPGQIETPPPPGSDWVNGNHLKRDIEHPPDSDRSWDDECAVCNNGGILVCCDGAGCRRVFHHDHHIPQLDGTPTGVWYCTFCTNPNQFKTDMDDVPRDERKYLTEYELKICQRILLKLYTHYESMAFHEPVDENLTEYYETIKKPMDFSKIRQRLDKNTEHPYKHVKKFIRDLNRVFINCNTFNTEDRDPQLRLCGIAVGQEYLSQVGQYFPDLVQLVKLTASSKRRSSWSPSPSNNTPRKRRVVVQEDEHDDED